MLIKKPAWTTSRGPSVCSGRPDLRHLAGCFFLCCSHGSGRNRSAVRAGRLLLSPKHRGITPMAAVSPANAPSHGSPQWRPRRIVRRSERGQQAQAVSPPSASLDKSLGVAWSVDGAGGAWGASRRRLARRLVYRRHLEWDFPHQLTVSSDLHRVVGPVRFIYLP